MNYQADKPCLLHREQQVCYITERRGYWQLECQSCLSDTAPDKIITMKQQSDKLKDFISEDQLQYQLSEIVEYYKRSIDKVIDSIANMSEDEQKLAELKKQFASDPKCPSVLLEFAKSRELIDRLSARCLPYQQAREEAVKIIQKSCSKLESLLKGDARSDPKSRTSLYQNSSAQSRNYQRVLPISWNTDLKEQLEKQIGLLYNQLTCTERDYLKYRAQVDALSDELDKLKKQQAEQDKAKDQIRSLTKLNSIMQRRTSELEQNFQTRASKLEEAVHKKQVQYDELKAESIKFLETQQHEIEKLEKQLESLKKQKYSTVELLSQKDNEIDKLKCQIDKLVKLEEQHKKSQKQLGKNAKQLEKNSKQQKALQGQIDSLKKENDQIKQRLEEVTLEFNRQQQLSEKETALKVAQERKKIEEEENGLNSLKERLATVTNQLELARKGQSKADETCTELRLQLEQKTRQIASLGQRIEAEREPKQQLTDLKSANQRLTRQLTELQSKLDQKVCELKQVNITLTTRNSQKAKLQKDLATSKFDLDQVRTESRALRAKLFKLEIQERQTRTTRQSTLNFEDEVIEFEGPRTPTRLGDTQRVGSIGDLDASVRVVPGFGRKPTTGESSILEGQSIGPRASFIEGISHKKQSEADKKPRKQKPKESVK